MDRRIIKTKKAIQNAYFNLLIEKGTSKITISEIARRANIDRKTFYLHYESTDEILREVAKDRFTDLMRILEDNSFFERPFDAGIFLQSLNRLIEKDIELHQEIAAHSDFGYFWMQIREILVQTIVDMLSKFVDLNAKELSIYARFLASGVTNVYSSWLNKEIPVSLDELSSIVSDIIYYGIQRFLPATV